MDIYQKQGSRVKDAQSALQILLSFAKKELDSYEKALKETTR